MQQYAGIYSLQNYFAVNKYLHTVASVGILFTFNIAFFPKATARTRSTALAT